MGLPELWPGADVRWVGPARLRGGVRLRPGDRAVVLDAGRHGLPPSTALYHASGAQPRRRPRGVLVRLGAGATVRVPRRHLELVAPDHPLRPEHDGSEADWFLRQLVPWRRAAAVTVASLVPRGLPQVACVRHREAYPGELDRAAAAVLVELLGRHTSTPGDVLFAVWVGWGGIPPQRFPGAAVIATEGRGHFLLRGPLEGALTPIGVSGSERPVSGIWWPADRAWLVVTEIDFAWTFVGGSERLVDELVGHAELDAVRTSPDSPAVVLGEEPGEELPPGR